jgi:MFS transporter, PAT family, beta-lactamase induction signal transducer AmpG
LLFILLYKLGDTLASAMVTPFFKDLWPDPDEAKKLIAEVGKTFGLGATILGGILGGYGVAYLGINRALWIFGFIQAVTIPSFSLLAHAGPSYWGMVYAVGLENFTAGMGTSAYAAYMGGLCNRIMGIPRTVLSAPTGWIAKEVGWEAYFCLCAAAAIPGLLLLFRVAPWRARGVDEVAG